MKTLVTLVDQLSTRKEQRTIRVVLRLLLVFAVLVLVFSLVFDRIMAYEGSHDRWLAGFYWTLVVVSTLGFGDITFTGDLERSFAVVFSPPRRRRPRSTSWSWLAATG